MNLKFMSLASGSSGNCYYLGTDQYGILIDAGIGVRTIKRALKDNNIAFESIIGLLITHDHADHIKGAGCLGEKYCIPVYTTELVLEGMDRNYCMTERLISSRRIIHKENKFTLRDFEITPFEVPHDGTDNVGYFIQYGGLSFAFATDLGYVPVSVKTHLSRANFLVIEANYDREMLEQGNYPPHLKHRIVNDRGHMCNTDTAEFLAEIITPDLKYVFLCHLSRENNHPELAFKTIEFRLKQEGIIIGKDVQLVVLKRNNPSDVYYFE